MRSLIRQTAAFVITFVAALALLSVAAAFAQAALTRAASVTTAGVAGLAGSFLLPSVLIALLAAALYGRARGASLAMAALAVAALAGGRGILERRPAAQPAAPAAMRLDTLVVPHEIGPMADPGVWLYAGEVRADRLRDVLTIASTARRTGELRLSYAAEVRPGRDLAVGGWRLSPQPAALTLVAADAAILSIAEDLAALERRARGASQGGEPALTLAAVLLAFAGTGVIVRRSRWPLLGWSLSLLVARGALLALGPRGQALAERTLGAVAPLAPVASVLILAVLLAAADLLTPGSRTGRRGALLG